MGKLELLDEQNKFLEEISEVNSIPGLL
jgi:hypothetical protein